MTAPSNRALFLDRDGVINIDRGYVHRREEFLFQDGIFELCRAAQDVGYLLMVVTNQAGIARGYYTEPEFLDLMKWMNREFADRGIHIARVYYCPYHPTAGIGRYRYDSPDRKPNPGMLLQARADFNVDLAASVLVGDRSSDIDAARAAGVGTRILLRPSEDAEAWAADVACHLASSLDEIRSRFFSPPR